MFDFLFMDNYSPLDFKVPLYFCYSSESDDEYLTRHTKYPKKPRITDKDEPKDPDLSDEEPFVNRPYEQSEVFHQDVARPCGLRAEPKAHNHNWIIEADDVGEKSDDNDEEFVPSTPSHPTQLEEEVAHDTPPKSWSLDCWECEPNRVRYMSKISGPKSNYEVDSDETQP